MAETIDIVRLDAAGNVVETLVDHVPAGWSAARTELGKLRLECCKNPETLYHTLHLRGVENKLT